MFLAKPFRPDELMQAIAPLLGIKTTDRSSSFVWKRRADLPPTHGDTPELSQGRKMLNIYRRGTPPPNSTR
jgi:hypothetical protein